MNLILLVMVVVLIAGCASGPVPLARPPSDGAGGPQGVLRVNCGAQQPYVDPSGRRWEPDQMLGDGHEWGALAGGTITREKLLQIADAEAAEVYRTERFNPGAYEFALPDGAYTVGVHMAETFDSIYRPGMRVFDIRIGELLHEDADPFGAGGGFARPLIVEFAGVQPVEGKLRIEFVGKVQSPLVNGIEVVPAPDAPMGVRRTAGRDYEYAGLRPRMRVSPDVKATRALFVGNSLNIFWALPETVEAMVNTGQENVRLEAVRSVSGGKNIAWLYTNGDAARKIESGGFDYVSLQGTAGTAEHRAGLAEAVGKFDEIVRKHGGQTLLFCRWMRRADSDQTQADVNAMYEEVAGELGVRLLPIGQAWRRVRRERPKLNLHNPDGLHPGLAGSYLTACVFYSVLTGESPEGHPFPAVGRQEVPVQPEVAVYLQRIAWETVREHSDPDAR